MDKYTLIRKLEGHHNDVVSCEFSPDGALLATASYDTRVIVWDHHKGTVLLELGYGTLQLSRKTKQKKQTNFFRLSRRNYHLVILLKSKVFSLTFQI